MMSVDDLSWIRFEQGVFRRYIVDIEGNFRCQDCDRPLQRKARRCGKRTGCRIADPSPPTRPAGTESSTS